MNINSLNLSLSVEERDLILTHAEPSPKLAQQLRFGLLDGKMLNFTLEPMVVEDLLGCTDEVVEVGESRKLRRRFERIYLKVLKTAQLHSNALYGGEMGTVDTKKPMDAVRELLSSREFESMDDLNATLGRLNRAHNASPQTDFLGLSPEQLSPLIYSDWTESTVGLQCNENLSLHDADSTEIFHNARIFLNALIEKDGIKTTAKKGNLNRNFVVEMLDSMRWTEGYVEETWRHNKVLNEEDVMELNVLNVVCDLAGLTRKHKGKLLATKKAQELLNDAKAGELYHLLFLTFMRKFNLGFSDRIEDYDDVQNTMSFSIYVLGKQAQDWETVSSLSQTMFLPMVSEQFLPEYYIDPAEMVLSIRVLPPLIRFGLIEGRDDAEALYPRLDSVKKKPLFNEFLRFELPESL